MPVPATRKNASVPLTSSALPHLATAMIEPTNFAFIFCCQCLEIHHHLKALACAGIIFLLAFFIWGSLNLSSTLAGRRAVWLWGSIIAYSALLTSARVGMYLAFTVGRLYWPSQSKAGYILLLLGFSPATNNWQYVLVGFSQVEHQASLARPHWGQVLRVPQWS